MSMVVLLAYPIVLGLLGALAGADSEDPMLPRSSWGLVLLSVVELGLFGLVFLVFWLLGRPTAAQLNLPWRGGGWPVLRGLGYSIALRVGIAMVVLPALVMAVVFFDFKMHEVQKWAPQTDAIVDEQTLKGDPVYFLLVLTLISFVVAGLREELWRAGMLASFRSLKPSWFGGFLGGLIAVTIIALAFGLGHVVQGWLAVGMTTLLGIGLGTIIVFHRSIWDAVLAHGFFDATTFVFLFVLADRLQEMRGL